MAGESDVVIGNMHAMFMHVPIEMATSRRKQVELASNVWSSVLACTGQPATWE